MATAVVRYSASAMTDRGRKRSSNEDAFGYSVEHGVYLVCDGMGGAAAGEIASSLAVEEILRLVTERREKEEAASQLVPAIASEAVHSANEAIHSRSQRNAKLSGMGTTLVGLLTGLIDDERRVWIFHVGDSRCYRLHNRSIRQCTQDHSLVEEQVRLGRMTPGEAARSPLRNVITRALGTQGSVTPDVIQTEAEPGDLFLLCSDGLTRELSDEKIEAILNEGLNTSTNSPKDLDEICARLIKAANKAGGNDNITCLLVHVE